MPLQKVPNSDGTQSDYQDDPSQVTLALGDMLNLHDYQQTAEPGQWFYGVVDTISGKIYFVAGDVHDDPKNALQQNDRMKNTYASKPNAPDVGWKSLQPLGDPQQTEGIKGEPTGHNSVAKLYKLDVGQCLGFRLIMINGAFASFSDRSNSMNANKPDQRMVSVHPKGTNPATIPAVPGVPIWSRVLRATHRPARHECLQLGRRPSRIFSRPNWALPISRLTSERLWNSEPATLHSLRRDSLFVRSLRG